MFRTGTQEIIGILLQYLLYSVSFRIPVCQRTLSLVKLKWFKLLEKLGLKL